MFEANLSFWDHPFHHLLLHLHLKSIVLLRRSPPWPRGLKVTAAPVSAKTRRVNLCLSFSRLLNLFIVLAKIQQGQIMRLIKVKLPEVINVLTHDCRVGNDLTNE